MRPSVHLAFVIRSLSLGAVLALCLVSRSARAQMAPVPGSDDYCTPGAPCPLAPPVPPPAYSPALEAQRRATHEGQVRAQIEPSMRGRVAAEIDEGRRRAWIERGRSLERDPVPLGYPMVQTLVLGGVMAGQAGEKDEGEGVLVVKGSLSARFIPNRIFAFELGGSLTTGATTAPADRYRSLHIEPAFLVCGCAGPPDRIHTVVPWLRAAVDIGLPIDGGSRTPDASVAFKIGFEVDLLVARFGDGGFAAAALQTNAVLRFAAGGETSALRKATGGIEFLVGPSWAF